MNSIYELKPVQKEHLPDIARFWATECDYDIGETHFQRWFAADPDAFRMIVDKRGRIMGCGCAILQSETVYLLGAVAIAPKYRGLGLLKKILYELHARCPGANFGVSIMRSELAIKMYQSMGYTQVEDTYAHIYQGQLEGPLEPASGDEGTDSSEVVEVKPDDSPLEKELAKYDEVVHGFARKVRLVLLDDPAGMVIAIRRNGSLVGFAKGQRNLRDGGAFLGPIYADDASTAKRLFGEILKRFENQARISTYIVLSEQARALMALPWLKYIEKSARCYTDPGTEDLPQMQLNKLFSFDSLDACLI